jgi:hypothetical protein
MWESACILTLGGRFLDLVERSEKKRLQELLANVLAQGVMIAGAKEFLKLRVHRFEIVHGILRLGTRICR